MPNKGEKFSIWLEYPHILSSSFHIGKQFFCSLSDYPQWAIIKSTRNSNNFKSGIKIIKE